MSEIDNNNNRILIINSIYLFKMGINYYILVIVFELLKCERNKDRK